MTAPFFEAIKIRDPWNFLSYSSIIELAPLLPNLLTPVGSFLATFHSYTEPTFSFDVMKLPDLSGIHTI